MYVLCTCICIVFREVHSYILRDYHRNATAVRNSALHASLNISEHTYPYNYIMTSHELCVSTHSSTSSNPWTNNDHERGTTLCVYNCDIKYFDFVTHDGRKMHFDARDHEIIISLRLRRLADVRTCRRLYFSVGLAPRERQHARSIPAFRKDSGAQCTLWERHTLRSTALPLDPEADWHLAFRLQPLVAKREITLNHAHLHVRIRTMFRSRAFRPVRFAPREGHLCEGKAPRSHRLLPDFRDQVLLPRCARHSDQQVHRACRRRLASCSARGSSQDDAEERARESQTHHDERAFSLHWRVILPHHRAVIRENKDQRQLDVQTAGVSWIRSVL